LNARHTSPGSFLARAQSPALAGAAMGLGVLLGLALRLAPPGFAAGVLAACDVVADDLFLRLLKMIVAPLVLFSIMAGVAGVADPSRLGRLGVRTFVYYVATSLLAILTGLALVNVIRPGVGATLPLAAPAELPSAGPGGVGDLVARVIPENVFDALARADMLQLIFFALVAGAALATLSDRWRRPLGDVVEGAFQLMTRVAQLVLVLLPAAIVALLARVVARSDLAAFRALGLYVLTVVLALAFHALVTLPLVARFLAGISPLRWARAVAPALFTAFSTSSSSATLPVTLESVEERGGVPNEVSSFVLPLGATINMDGTALYECVAVIFLAQHYAGAAGYELTLARQAIVVGTALLASIGAAGIPSAGLVMMTIILKALDLPLEGALLLLAVDRPLDMLRTATNVWSDTIGAATVARLEGSPARPLPGD